MFKSLRNGRRNASPTKQSSRISGLRGQRGTDISLSMHRRPAFLPDTPQEQTFDGKNSRLSGLES